MHTEKTLKMRDSARNWASRDETDFADSVIEQFAEVVQRAATHLIGVEAHELLVHDVFVHYAPSDNGKPDKMRINAICQSRRNVDTGFQLLTIYGRSDLCWLKIKQAKEGNGAEAFKYDKATLHQFHEDALKAVSRQLSSVGDGLRFMAVLTDGVEEHLQVDMGMGDGSASGRLGAAAQTPSAMAGTGFANVPASGAFVTPFGDW